MKAGLVMNIFTLLTACLITASIGDLVFHWNVYPDWITSTVSTTIETTLSSDSALSTAAMANQKFVQWIYDAPGINNNLLSPVYNLF
jgi:hypothetical protein